MAPRDRSQLDNIDESTLPVVSSLPLSINSESISIDDGIAAATTTKATTTAASQQRTSRNNRKVTFHLVHVREFDRVVGDHPEVKVGPPIALGWNYVTKSPVLVEAYDIDRDLKKSRNKPDRLTSIARRNILFEYGFTESDFRLAEQHVKVIQEQRSSSKQEEQVTKKGTIVNDADRPKMHRIGRSFRKNFMITLSAAAKAMAAPTMVAM